MEQRHDNDPRLQQQRRPHPPSAGSAVRPLVTRLPPQVLPANDSGEPVTRPAVAAAATPRPSSRTTGTDRLPVALPAVSGLSKVSTMIPLVSRLLSCKMCMTCALHVHARCPRTSCVLCEDANRCSLSPPPPRLLASHRIHAHSSLPPEPTPESRPRLQRPPDRSLVPTGAAAVAATTEPVTSRSGIGSAASGVRGRAAPSAAAPQQQPAAAGHE